MEISEGGRRRRVKEICVEVEGGGKNYFEKVEEREARDYIEKRNK